LRSFQRRISEFDARGVRVVGISVDPPEINRRQSQKLGYSFPLLSDPKAEVIRRYDVLHPGAGPKGADIARPAEFLIDSNGMVRWVNLTENIAVRARPEQVLDAFNQIGPAAQ
jgi:peroxiredoxin 2/4